MDIKYINQHKSPGLHVTALTTTELGAVRASVTREMLTTHLGDVEYALDILAVQEIRRLEPPTRIANAPDHLLGIMNLRGVVMPIIDLRWRLGLPAVNDVNTVTVVVTLGERTVGLVVDAVSDVVTIEPERLQPCPRFGPRGQADFVAGIYQLQHEGTTRLLMVTDLAALLREI